ncbi:predicted protein [Naegleria gruberi]|uniref:Predicted protein n=1 Tax=Naegleria gruberi TaxID=5762 RepID=D2V4Z0_NAEGR|nr:uncharacterized protein NAEGRDRAFT_63954 [Naegleria gruberi]EFC48014.1 predicted protein [Naegleria gruberi]|eukprot:XP_002680758.1 predicted protein [Naegleria gruberi strain NEG-M]
MNCNRHRRYHSKQQQPLLLTTIIAAVLIIFAWLQASRALDLGQSVDNQLVRPGGKFPMTNQTLIEELSNFIVSNSSLNQICSVQRVINPQQQIVAGTMYYMTIQVSRIKPGSGYTTAQCGTVNPANLEVVCEEVKIFKPLNSNTYQIKNETIVTCPP